MSTLNGVKYTQKWVTEEELKVLELFKECEQVRFIRYNEKNVEKAMSFSRMLNSKLKQNSVIEIEGSTWVSSNKGKIEATAFLE